MLANTSEFKMRIVRIILLLGWIGILVLCAVDIGQTYLTDPESKHFIKGLEGRDISLRGTEFEAQTYNIAPRLFWGLAIPVVVLILIFMGHDAWRRICPLSLVSQIPRLFNWTRKVGPKGKKRIALIPPTSFLAKYAILIQFSLFAFGVLLRLTVLSANPEWLLLFTLALFIIAFSVGLIYGGKTWCHYFCPMNVVQLTIAGARGLNTAAAETNISQSMCRKPSKNGDQSICVGCNSPCPDVDVERNYWTKLPQMSRRIAIYGYLGVVIGFIHGVYAASGSWSYGAAVWYDSDPMAIGFSPFGQLLPIPRIIGSTVLMALWITVSIGIGLLLEKLLQKTSQSKKPLTKESAQHHSVLIVSLLALLLLIYQIALPGMGWLPKEVTFLVGLAVTIALSFWVYRSWFRTSQIYQRESLATSLRKQLLINHEQWEEQLENRNIKELSVDEVHLLTNITPKIESKSRIDFYENFLSDAISQGTADSYEGRKLLQNLRERFSISQDEHQSLLNKLQGSYDIGDSLLISKALRTNSFKEHLEKLILEAVEQGQPLEEALKSHQSDIAALRSDYAISDEEEKAILDEISSEEGTLANVIDLLMDQLQHIKHMQNQLDSSLAEIYLSEFLLREAKTVFNQVLGLLETVLEEDEFYLNTSDQLVKLYPSIIEQLQKDEATLAWSERLPNIFWENLTQQIPESQILDVSPISKQDCLMELSESDNIFVSLVACRAAQMHGMLWQVEKIEDIAQKLNIDTNITGLSDTLLEVITYNHKRLTFNRDIIAGRLPECDWVIDQSQASRRHFSIKKEKNHFYCEDLNSSNGTLLNGANLRNEKQQLKSRNTISVAHDAAASKVNIISIPKFSLQNPVDTFVYLSGLDSFKKLTEEQLFQLAKSAEQLQITNADDFTLALTIGHLNSISISGHHSIKLPPGTFLTEQTLSVTLQAAAQNNTKLHLMRWKNLVIQPIIEDNPSFHLELLEKTNDLILKLFGEVVN